jgi:hypothetical protein
LSSWAWFDLHSAAVPNPAPSSPSASGSGTFACSASFHVWAAGVNVDLGLTSNYRSTATRQEPPGHSVKQRIRMQSASTKNGTLPNSEDPPVELVESGQDLCIVCPISRDLPPPEVHIRRRPPEHLALVPMPQASVDENDCTVLGKSQVRASRQIPTVQSVAEAACEQSSSNDLLRFCVLAANSRHAVTSLFCGEDVGHSGRQCTTASVREPDMTG